jgi:hypothetical protein
MAEPPLGPRQVVLAEMERVDHVAQTLLPGFRAVRDDEVAPTPNPLRSVVRPAMRDRRSG